MLNRRDFLSSTAAAVIGSFVSGAVKAAAGLPTRHNVGSTAGKEMLKIYAEAVKAMKTRSDQDPRSWTFQWYIHATPNSAQSEITRVFGNSTGPNRTLAEQSWYTCQSHMGQPEDYFLPWHRLYVMYFEEIIRSISEKPEFTLPYWDYTTPSSYAIPEELQTKNRNNPTWGSLYISNRNVPGGVIPGAADVNAGEPLNKNFRGARNFLILPDFDNDDYSSFCSSLDGNLHGSVHVYTGDEKNMADVPFAARDPIFWLHHCNIDRIWAAWNTKWKNPTETNGKSWTDTKFVYADGTGGRAEVAISTVANPAALPYQYDALPSAGAASVAANVAGSASVSASSSGWTTLLKSGAPGLGANAATAAAAPAAPGGAGISLAASPKTVELSPAAPNANLAAAAASVAPAGPARFLLTLRDVTAQTDPHTTYEVFLDLPEGASKETADQHYVGLLNFFGVASSMEHMGHGGKTYNFDVTKVMANLKNSKALAEKTSVTFVPVGPPAEGSAPVISGGIEIQQRN